MAKLSIEDYRRIATLRATLRSFSRQTERIAREEGLTPRQYLLLLMIKGAEDGSERSRVTELAKRLQLTQSTVTELVRRAEDSGLLVREGSADDGRVSWLSLSGEGERRLEAVARRHGPERRRLLELIKQLERIDADHVDRVRTSARPSSSRKKRLNA
jgi:DNA-binding MarR family transcriptional regulator